MSSHDPESPPRLSQAGPDFAQQLLRSARLDQVPAALPARLLNRTRRELEPKRASTRSAYIGVGVASALLGALAVLALRPAPPPATQLQAELPRASASQPVRAAQSTTSTSTVASAPTVSASPTLPALPASARAPALPPCPRVSKAAGAEPLIDDFEEENARVQILEGRAGTWRAYGPPGTRMKPAVGSTVFPVSLSEPREGSRFGLHVSGGRISNGVSVGADFTSGTSRCYDASAYAGIAFWARGKGRIALSITMIDVLEKRWGGLCAANCYDAHHQYIDLGPQWQRFEVHWQDLEQTGYGTPLAFDPARLSSFGVTVEVADSPFDFWVDDISFLPASR